MPQVWLIRNTKQVRSHRKNSEANATYGENEDATKTQKRAGRLDPDIIIFVYIPHTCLKLHAFILFVSFLNVF